MSETQQDERSTAEDVLGDALIETEDDDGWVHPREVLDWLDAQGWVLAPAALAPQPSADAEALRRVLALADEFDAQVPWPHSWIGNRIREAAGAGYDQGAGE